MDSLFLVLLPQEEKTVIDIQNFLETGLGPLFQWSYSEKDKGFSLKERKEDGTEVLYHFLLQNETLKLFSISIPSKEELDSIEQIIYFSRIIDHFLSHRSSEIFTTKASSKLHSELNLLRSIDHSSKDFSSIKGLIYHLRKGWFTDPAFNDSKKGEFWFHKMFRSINSLHYIKVKLLQRQNIFTIEKIIFPYSDRMNSDLVKDDFIANVLNDNFGNPIAPWTFKDIEVIQEHASHEESPLLEDISSGKILDKEATDEETSPSDSPSH